MSDGGSNSSGLNSDLFELDRFLSNIDQGDDDKTGAQDGISVTSPYNDTQADKEAAGGSFRDTTDAAYFRSDFKIPDRKKTGFEESEVAIEDTRIIPKVEHTVYKEKPLVVVIDDDFTVLDIMKIYLARDYTYVGFTNPKDAIFYMNENIPSLVLLDSYMSMISTKKLVPIIRSYEYMKEVPIYYICEESEKAAVKKKLSDDISGIITRPVARGDLQKVLDKVFS